MPEDPPGGVSSPSRPIALVIEDDEDVTGVLEMVLTGAGFTVVTAADGRRGTELARELQPALTTIDVSMPEMDGFEATRRIREFSGTYIVIISTRSAEQDVLAGFDAGADDYVPKPIRPRELQARLAAVARRPVTAFAPEPATAAWALAAEDAARSAYHHRVVAGLPVDAPPTTPEAPGPLPPADAPVTPDLDEPADTDAEDASADAVPEVDTGNGGREGMLEIGMRFVGNWVECHGLRINPARGLVVVDDRLVDLEPEQFDLLQLMLYSGTRTRTSRYLALRLRGETEEQTTRLPRHDEAWIESLMAGLFKRLGEDPDNPRWVEARPEWGYRLVRRSPSLPEH